MSYSSACLGLFGISLPKNIALNKKVMIQAMLMIQTMLMIQILIQIRLDTSKLEYGGKLGT